MTQAKRAIIAAALALVVALGAILGTAALLRTPAATSPEGAYAAVAYVLGEGRPERVYDYLDDRAREACSAIVRDAERAVALVDAHYPPAERTRARAPYVAGASAGDASALWLARAEARGWLAELRADLSGVARVTLDGERAVVETARGSAIEFVRRADGTFGLTRFTPELEAERERLAHDLERIERAAADYARAGKP